MPQQQEGFTSMSEQSKLPRRAVFEGVGLGRPA
jgi:hypothetical protein